MHVRGLLKRARDLEKSLDHAGVCPLREADHVRIGINLGVCDLHRSQIGVRHELDVGHHTNSNAALDGHPHRFAATDLHHRVDRDLGASQRSLEGKPGG